MKDVFSMVLMISLIGIIIGIGGIIFSLISKRPNGVFMRIAICSVILFVVVTIAVLST